jgi:hypothetical protein
MSAYLFCAHFIIIFTDVYTDIRTYNSKLFFILNKSFIMFTMRRSHVIQPYKVGSKTGKSIAVVIPHDIVEQYKIDPSSIIILKTDKLTKKITLEAMKEAEMA